MRITFDRSGVQVVERELGDTRLGSEFYIPDVRDEDRVDTVTISDEARTAAAKRKAA